MAALAAEFACLIKAGETIFLAGDLGAGKSTFARALLRAIAKDPALEVPSPTFPLLIPYETKRMPVAHYDLYRLGDVSELDELGFHDTISEHLTLIEWPERLQGINLADRLEIRFDETGDPATRTLSLTGHGQMAAKLQRFQQMRAFLAGTPFEKAAWVYCQGDASTRSYIRLLAGDETALFMNAPPQPDGPVIRDGKPYSQIAHLAEDMTSFVAISNTLGKAGFSLPEIMQADIEKGLLLISDFGEEQYYHLITEKNANIKSLYEPAIDTLVALRRRAPAPMLVEGAPYHLPKLDGESMMIEVELLADWYWPYVKQMPIEKDALQAYIKIWQALFEKVEASDHSHWILRDFHSPNIMALAGKKGISAVGIIDFQDALQGNAAYDVASLCQDARLTIPHELAEHLLARYINGAKADDPAFDEAEFRTAYAILCAQRACKLLGIFIRLKVRDNKAQYLAHLPRIWSYLEQSLPHPVLAPLNTWFETHFPPPLRVAFFKPPTPPAE